MDDIVRLKLFLGFTIPMHLAASFAHPVTPTIIRDRGFGDYMFGVAFAAMATMGFLASPFWGRMISVIGSRWVILICGLGYATGQVLFWVSMTELAVIGARMFAGIFGTGLITGCLTYIVNTSPEDRRNGYIVSLTTIQMVGGAFGFFLGGLLGEVGIRVTAWSQFLLLALAAVGMFVACRDDKTSTLGSVDRKTLSREINPIRALVEGRHILTPLLLLVFAVAVLADFGNTALDQSFNYYLRAQLELPSSANGTIKGVIGILTLVINSTLGYWLVAKTSIGRSSFWIYLLCAAGTLGVAMFGHTVLFMASSMVYFSVFALSVPLTQSLLAQTAQGMDTNLVVGYQNGVKSLGGIVGALASGFLYTQNPKWPFFLGFIAFLGASAVSLVYCQYSSRALRQTVSRGN